MALSLDELIALVESRGKNTAVDPETMQDYEEAKYLQEREGVQNRRIAESAGINPDAVKGMSRRDVQRLASQIRTARYDKESSELKKKYGTSERGLARKLEGKGQFRAPAEVERMARNEPDLLAAEGEEIERLFFPRGRKFSTRANAAELGAGIDELMAKAERGPKSADVTAQRAAAKLPEFERLSTAESEARILQDLERGDMSAGEAATIRTALKPKAALEEEEIMARMRPEAEMAARESDVYTAADSLLAPLMEATKLTLPEVRARKRLATELQKRAADPMDLEAMMDPRALPAKRRINNPAGVPTMVNPTGQAPNQLQQAEADFEEAAAIEPDPSTMAPVVPTPYDLATQQRKRRDEELDRMFSGGY